jgi:hypothetical protein
VAVAELAGVGRNGQATAAAIQIARGIDGRKRGEQVGAGLGRLTDPDLSRVSLAVPEWAGWASWPDGPNWLWPNIFKTKISNSNSNVISFLNSNQIQKFK